MKRPIKAAAIFAAALFASGAAACSGQTTYERYFYAMGTSAHLVLSGDGFPSQREAEAGFGALCDKISSELSATENCISATLDGSDIDRFNAAQAGEEVEISGTCFNALSLALEMYDFTGGYFNPAVYHSVAAYNFPQSVPPQNMPDAQTLEAFTSLCSHFPELAIEARGGKYFARKPSCTAEAGGVVYSLAIDLGGLGKGMCADSADDFISEAGFSGGYFDFSSSSMALKRYKGGDYELLPRDPRDNGRAICSVKVSDCRLSTSGDYEHFYEVDGVRYCHIIDPFTGAPIRTGISSVTVIGGSAAEDDALTTALSCMGRDKAVEFINSKLSDKTVIMLVQTGDGYGIITNRPAEISQAVYPVINLVEKGRIVLKDVT